MTHPSAAEVEKLLGDLLGVPVTVQSGAAPRAVAGLVGSYRTPGGELVAAIWLDRILSASAGAALTMMPKASLDAALEQETLPDSVVDNAAEVLDVLSAVIHAPARVTMSGVAPTPPSPQDLTVLMARSVDLAWFTVDVAGYGAGAAVVAHAR